MKGLVHSIETFGTVDGPGIRFVLFLKGCPLRCKYCHNPDTWTTNGAQEYSVEDIVNRVLKYKGYYGDKGGITVSGGEPLVQMDFVIDLFKELKKHNINTAVDTSGFMYNPNNEESVKKHEELNKYTDLFLLDIKHIDNLEHIELTGVPNENTLAYAKFLSDNNKDMWIRHVVVPGITLNDEYLHKLKEFIDTLNTVKKIDVLPYHTMGEVKYNNLGIEYPLKGVKTPTKDEIINVKKILGVIKNDN